MTAVFAIVFALALVALVVGVAVAHSRRTAFYDDPDEAATPEAVDRSFLGFPAFVLDEVEPFDGPVLYSVPPGLVSTPGEGVTSVYNGPIQQAPDQILVDETYGVRELRPIAKEAGVPNWWNLRKPDLIAAINDAEPVSA